MITMHPPPTQPPHSALAIPPFQQSVLSSHPLTTPRPPTTCIVYPHRASIPPLASASTPSLRARSLLDSRSHAASQQLRTVCSPRHCCTNTVVRRARRTRCGVQSKMALCHSTRLAHTACSGTVLGWVGVYSTTGCTADSSRAESGAWCTVRVLVQGGVFPPRATRHTRNTAGAVRDTHQHGRTVAS
jgi:hypothetical protein